LQLADARSGTVRVRIDPNLFVDHDLMDSGFDAKRRLIVLSSLGERSRASSAVEEWFQKHLPWLHIAECPNLAILDLATAQQRLGLVHWTRQFILSADGSTFATCRACRDENGGELFWRVEVWDLLPHRAWFWSVAICAAAGSLGFCWRRIRRKRATQS
jgi:hypothetical protein